MTIQYCSDLHLEFPENKRFLKENPIIPSAEILLLAGDIVLFNKINEINEFWDFLSDSFRYVFWVPGNHEYYYFNLLDKQGSFKEALRDNIFIVNNLNEKINDINFIFSTLWTEINPAKSFEIRQRLNDFYVIKYGEDVLTPEIYNTLHKQSLDFIKSATQTPNEKKIVVTHHVPTYLNYPQEYKNSVLNSAFAVELYDFIDQSGIDFWIYGHTHYNTPEFSIGKTKLLTNQLAYVFHNEHKTFRPDKVLEI